jgi:hypothetical protein
LWLQDHVINKPDPVTVAMQSPTKYSPHIARMIKHRTDPTRYARHPTFDPTGPAPNINCEQPHEQFFHAPFAIWLTNSCDINTEKCCRPVRPHKVWAMIGFNDTKADALYKIPATIAIRRARSAPG